ncbi:hypothetical protein SAMD00019534_028780 [Acytostelium subglobosum LB1]|uniref:hypothetical protein n=1 Tax=Acytostelium subglobosum LB1 TaxID=1410327 RepID=UPI000644E768|nr:hypothetical protein SAMD00019534_028780 [Acytostelium subglobosum LB1]GAM19703.1 hypothetical protein SAMD00019534_028780 [Acytostelium subglobosum LB1]|eukprot:XP_012756465.1 hypothetical protein SAMD00019534_028780 [Acytostelium subglobosum LB1]
MINVLVWLYQFNYNIDLHSVAFIYENIVVQREYWRCISGTFSHANFVHLAFNTISLWSLRTLEIHFGSFTFITYTLLILVISIIIQFGYSGIAFGLITLLSYYSGSADLWLLQPLGSLLIIQMLVPNASFVGHLAGIISGALIIVLKLTNLFNNALGILTLTSVIIVSLTRSEWPSSSSTIQWFDTPIQIINNFTSIVKNSSARRIENGVILSKQSMTSNV